MRSKYRLLPVTAGIALFTALFAAGPPTRAQGFQNLNVQRMKLSNGLTVLALEDHTVPSIAYYTLFKVGSRNERPGITGLSHLFEHMMFNGSAKFKPKAFDQIVEAGGGSSNAFTTSDSTEYQTEFSSPTIDIAIKMEADRMRALKLDRANIEQERGIVKEERRVNTDNSIEGSMAEMLWNTAFVAHPYHWDTIGFMKDIDAIKLQDAQDYFRIHYAPNNAVLCVVGDFNSHTLFEKIRREYSDIPSQPAPRPVVNSEPPQPGERRVKLNRAAELPAIMMGYHIGNAKDPYDAALDVLSNILSYGESSRLYKSLVYDKQIATSVSATNESRVDPGLFTFYGQAQQGHTAEECENAIYAALKDIQDKGVTEREVQKARNVLGAHYVNSFKTNLGLAGQLAEYEANWGDWRKLYDYPKRHDKVTTADVQRVARKYFGEKNRTVVTLVPEKEAAAK